MAHTLWMRPQFAGLDELSWLQEMYSTSLAFRGMLSGKGLEDYFPRNKATSNRPLVCSSPPPRRAASTAHSVLGRTASTAARRSAEARKNVVPRGGSALGSGTSPPPDWLSPRGVSP